MSNRTSTVARRKSAEGWAELPYEQWKDTLGTLHMQLQIVGKLRLALSPFEPQWANVPLYVTGRGLTTGPMRSGNVIFEVQVDLIDHRVTVMANNGASAVVSMTERPVADFYREVVRALRRLHIDVAISIVPSEVTDPIPFDRDRVHNTYDPAAVTRFFEVLSRVDLVLKEHRAAFRGRTSNVAFFWGTFDHYLARYSGRPAETPPGVGRIHRLGGGAETIAVGFWPGSERYPLPAFFSYVHPKPAGVESEPVGPSGAYWEPKLGEFVLPYDDVRNAASPRDAILEFCRSTYAAGAHRARWDPALLPE